MHATLPRAPAAARPPFSISVRVYYEDTDAGGVVYYANYLRFLERARTEWLRAAGFEQQHLLEVDQLAFVVRRVEADFRAAARLDDLLDVRVEIERLGGASMVFAQRIERGDDLLLEAKVTVACVDWARKKPTALPEAMRSQLQELMKAPQ